MGADLNGEAVGDNHGGAVSLSGDGMRLAVGAKKHNDGGADTGHTRVYQWLSSSWKQLGGDLGDEVGFAAGDEAGSAVSLSKDGSRVAPSGRPRKGRRARAKFEFTDMSIPLESTTIQPQVSGLSLAMISREMQLMTGLDPPSHCLVRVHVSPSVRRTTIPPMI